MGEYDLFGDSLMKFFGWRPGTFGSSWNTHFFTCAWCDQRETGDSSPLLSNQEIKAFRQECSAFFAHFGNILYFIVPVTIVWVLFLWHVKKEPLKIWVLCCGVKRLNFYLGWIFLHVVYHGHQNQILPLVFVLVFFCDASMVDLQYTWHSGQWMHLFF